MANILFNVFGVKKLGADIKLRVAAASLGYDEKECIITTNSFVLQVAADSYRVSFVAGSKETRREGVIEFTLEDQQTAVIDLSVNSKGEILDWKYAVHGAVGAQKDGSGKQSGQKKKPGDGKEKKKRKIGFVGKMWIVFFAAVIIVAIVYAVAAASVGGGSAQVPAAAQTLCGAVRSLAVDLSSAVNV